MNENTNRGVTFQINVVFKNTTIDDGVHECKCKCDPIQDITCAHVNAFIQGLSNGTHNVGFVPDFTLLISHYRSNAQLHQKLKFHNEPVDVSELEASNLIPCSVSILSGRPKEKRLELRTISGFVCGTSDSTVTKISHTRN